MLSGWCQLNADHSICQNLKCCVSVLWVYVVSILCSSFNAYSKQCDRHTNFIPVTLAWEINTTFRTAYFNGGRGGETRLINAAKAGNKCKHICNTIIQYETLKPFFIICKLLSFTMRSYKYWFMCTPVHVSTRMCHLQVTVKRTDVIGYWHLGMCCVYWIMSPVWRAFS